ncbi:hypothetical protein [Nemorincola caseinilytica]
MKNTILFSFLLGGTIALSSQGAQAQGMALNTTGSTADNSAMLDVASTTKGILIPRMTQAQRTAITTPAEGLMVYQTDVTKGFYYYNGTAWTVIGGGGGSPTGSAGGDLTGNYPNPTLAATGVTSGTYGSSTQVPAYTVNSKGQITAASNITITGTTPGGSAGGDITGTYPNPTIANSSITSSKILDGTIVNSDVSTTAAIAYSKLNLAASVTASDLSASGTRSSSTFLRGDNTWATPTATPSGSAGGHLTGTYPNPSLADNTVTIAKIASTGGTASSTTYLRGDGQWATPSGGGGGSTGTGASPSKIPYAVSGNTTVVSGTGYYSPTNSVQQSNLNAAGLVTVTAPTTCTPTMTITSYVPSAMTWNLYSVAPSTSSSTFATSTLVGTCSTTAASGGVPTTCVITGVSVSAGTILTLSVASPGSTPYGFYKAFSCD